MNEKGTFALKQQHRPRRKASTQKLTATIDKNWARIKAGSKMTGTIKIEVGPIFRQIQYIHSYIRT